MKNNAVFINAFHTKIFSFVWMLSSILIYMKASKGRRLSKTPWNIWDEEFCNNSIRLKAFNVFTKRFTLDVCRSPTAWKVSKYGVISGPYLDTFYAVSMITLCKFSPMLKMSPSWMFEGAMKKPLKRLITFFQTTQCGMKKRIQSLFQQKQRRIQKPFKHHIWSFFRN